MPLRRVRQDGVGLLDLKERGACGLFPPGIAVRVASHRSLAVGALDFFVGGVLVHAERFV